MLNITNDQELKAALDSLPLQDQRSIGLLYANSIKMRDIDPGLSRALELALDSDHGDQARAMAYKAAKSVATRTYTACGRDTDWEAQAEHFVAAACSAALTPAEQMTASTNPAWRAAIQSRMANNCLMMTNDSADPGNEARKQYEICEEFLLAHK